MNTALKHTADVIELRARSKSARLRIAREIGISGAEVRAGKAQVHPQLWYLDSETDHWIPINVLIFTNAVFKDANEDDGA